MDGDVNVLRKAISDALIFLSGYDHYGINKAKAIAILQTAIKPKQARTDASDLRINFVPTREHW